MDAIDKGVLLLYSGRNVLRFLPPLSISQQEVQKVLVVLDELLSMEEKRRECRLLCKCCTRLLTAVLRDQSVHL